MSLPLIPFDTYIKKHDMIRIWSGISCERLSWSSGIECHNPLCSSIPYDLKYYATQSASDSLFRFVIKFLITQIQVYSALQFPDIEI